MRVSGQRVVKTVLYDELRDLDRDFAHREREKDADRFGLKFDIGRFTGEKKRVPPKPGQKKEEDGLYTATVNDKNMICYGCGHPINPEQRFERKSEAGRQFVYHELCANAPGA